MKKLLVVIYSLLCAINLSAQDTPLPQYQRRINGYEKTFFVLIFMACACAITGFAQSIPSERLFFCSNKKVYGWNEDISVEGIIMSTDSAKLPLSRYTYIDVFNVSDSLCMHLKTKNSMDGSFQIAIPAGAIGRYGLFFVRAYTRQMLNYPAEMLPFISIGVEANVLDSRTCYNCSEELDSFNLHKPAAFVKSSTYTPEQYMTISGIAKYRIDKHPIKNGSVLAFQRSTQQVYTGETDETGHFCIPVEDFFTGEEFYLQAYDKKGREYACMFELDEEPIPLFHHLPAVEENDMTETAMPVYSKQHGLGQINTLPEVIIRSYKKNSSADKDSKKHYKTKYLTHEDLLERGMMSIADIVQYFFEYMYVSENAKTGKRMLCSRRDALTSAPTPVRIIVDGNEWEYSELENILNIDNLEDVEFLNSGETLGVKGVRFAIGGALLVTTSSGKAPKPSVKSKGQTFVMKGIEDLSRKNSGTSQ